MTVADVALAVGEASLRGSLALVAVLALRGALAARAGAGARRALLLAVVLAIPTLPLLGAILPGVGLSPPRGLVLPRLAPAEALVAPSGAPLKLLSGLAVIWLVGVAVMLARLAAGLMMVRSLTRAATTLRDPAWIADRDRMAASLRLKRAPELRLSARECVPHAWGFVRPVVVVPRSAGDWPAPRRRAVLAHELGHLARREPLARIAADVVRAIHWFDPLLRRAVAVYRRESEMAADELAVAAGVDARAYVDALVSLARERLAPPPLRAVPGFSGCGELERRVARILAPPTASSRAPAPRPRRRIGAPALGVAMIAVMAVPRLAPEASPLHRWSDRYGIPVALAEEIFAAAEGEGIEPAIAFGLVAEESAFDAARTSARGAVGLTQVLLSTARRVEPGLSPGELRDDSVNLRVGFRYLHSQIEREGGSLVHGLLAYALGPARLDDIRRRGEPVPLDYPARVLAHRD